MIDCPEKPLETVTVAGGGGGGGGGVKIEGLRVPEWSENHLHTHSHAHAHAHAKRFSNEKLLMHDTRGKSRGIEGNRGSPGYPWTTWLN